MKKYLLLIPTLFVMLLNVIGCGQVVYASDSVVDYSQYWITLESYDDKYFYNDEALISEFQPILSNRVGNVDYPYYFVCFYVDKYSYSSFVENGGTLSIRVWFVFLKSSDFSSNSYGILLGADYDDTFTLTASFRIDDSYQITSDLFSISYYYTEYGNLLYYTNTSYFIQSQYQMQPLPESDYFNDSNVYLYQNSNIPDFPFPDFVNHGGSSDKLKVEVEFDPLLSGTVDRNVSGSLVSSFKMNITNNSKSPIQYRMAIFEGNVSSFDSCFSPYNSSNCIFVYMTHDWIYCKDVTKMRSLTATDNLLLQNVGTSWHYLEGKSSFSQTFNYSQINFSKDKTYSVVVEAGLTDLDHSSGYFVENIGSLKRVENRDKENLKYILDYSTFSTVFSSTFSFDSLKGISYDSSDTSFGIIANSSNDDYTYAIHDRQAFYDENGNLDFIGYNPFDDEDSYVYNPLIKSPDEWKDENNILYDDSSSLGSIGFSSGDFSFGSGFSNFGSMLGSVFNIFPSNFWKMFTAGFISIIVIAIVKAVK